MKKPSRGNLSYTRSLAEAPKANMWGSYRWSPQEPHCLEAPSYPVCWSKVCIGEISILLDVQILINIPCLGFLSSFTGQVPRINNGLPTFNAGERDFILWREGWNNVYHFILLAIFLGSGNCPTKKKKNGSLELSGELLLDISGFESPYSGMPHNGVRRMILDSF